MRFKNPALVVWWLLVGTLSSVLAWSSLQSAFAMSSLVRSEWTDVSAARMDGLLGDVGLTRGSHWVYVSGMSDEAAWGTSIEATFQVPRSMTVARAFHLLEYGVDQASAGIETTDRLTKLGSRGYLGVERVASDKIKIMFSND